LSGGFSGAVTVNVAEAEIMSPHLAVTWCGPAEASFPTVKLRADVASGWPSHRNDTGGIDPSVPLPRPHTSKPDSNAVTGVFGSPVFGVSVRVGCWTGPKDP